MSERIYEEDIELAVKECSKFLGPVGRMLYPTPEYPDAIVYSKKFGNLWYGDLTEDDMAMVDLASRAMNTDVEILVELTQK